MTNGSWAKRGLIIASVAVVGMAICVAVVLLFAVEEEPAGLGPLDAPLIVREHLVPPGEEPEVEREAAPARGAAPGTAAPAPRKEIEPVEGALIEVRFRDLAAFRRSLSELIDDLRPGLGEIVLAILDANLGGRPDWLGEGPALLVVRKVTAGSYPVALSLPVRTPDGFLTALERTRGMGPREELDGGLVRFVRFGAAGEPDVDVYARVAGGRAAVSPDRQLLKGLSGEPAAPAADLQVRIDPRALVEAYADDMDRFLNGAPFGIRGKVMERIRTGLALMEAVARDLDDLTVTVRIGEEEVVRVVSATAAEGSAVEQILEALKPVGSPDELKWLPVDCSATCAFGIDGEKLNRGVAALVAATGNEALMKEALQRGEIYGGTGVVTFGAGGECLALSAFRAPDKEAARGQFERALSGEFPVSGVGTVRLAYERGVKKIGEVEIDRARAELKGASQKAQIFMGLFPGMFELHFGFPAGAALVSWGIGGGEALDAAIARPGTGGASLAATEFYKDVPAEACLAGELHLLRFAATLMPVLSTFGVPAVDLSDWTAKDIPHAFFAWKEGRTLHVSMTMPRSALRLYGEVVSEILAPAGGVDPGF